MSSLNSYMLSSSNCTPKTQPLNKQEDSISEVELNSSKGFSNRKQKEKNRERAGKKKKKKTEPFQGLL